MRAILALAAASFFCRMPRDTIQRTIHMHLAPFRACYRDGLRRNPELRGRVVTKLVIEPDGTVSLAVDGGSDLPDEGVRACVRERFVALRFEPLEGNHAVVVYPFVMRSGEEPPAPAFRFADVWRHPVYGWMEHDGRGHVTVHPRPE